MKKMHKALAALAASMTILFVMSPAVSAAEYIKMPREKHDAVDSGTTRSSVTPGAAHWTIPPVTRQWGNPQRPADWTIPSFVRQWDAPQRSSDWRIPPYTRQWGIPD
ncbi:MAG: hypothetical protein R3308_04595 [Thiohalobacterales bacterium]|nr:hypothetical protein [Thiohalobacterales bacterium]